MSAVEESRSYPSTFTRLEKLPNVGLVAGLVLGYAGLGLIYGDLRLIDPSGPRIVRGWLWAGALAIAVLVYVVRTSKHRARLTYKVLSIGGITALLLALTSNIFHVGGNYWIGPSGRICLLMFGTGVVALLASRGVVGLRALCSPYLLIVSQFVVCALFIDLAAGRLIFSDDHPGFLYRLLLLTEAFPFIPFYDIYWNAGVPAREFFASGSMNVFALSWPVLASIDPRSLNSSANYTLLVPEKKYGRCQTKDAS